MYHFNSAGMIVRESDNASFPADPSNSHYAALIASGAEIAPYARYASVSDAQAEKLAALSARREAAEQLFVLNGMPIKFDADSRASIDQTIAYLEKSGVPSVRWQVRRGAFTTLSLADLTAIGIAGGAHRQACFNNAETLAKQILSARSIEDVERLSLESGWPGA